MQMLLVVRENRNEQKDRLTCSNKHYCLSARVVQLPQAKIFWWLRSAQYSIRVLLVVGVGINEQDIQKRVTRRCVTSQGVKFGQESACRRYVRKSHVGRILFRNKSVHGRIMGHFFSSCVCLVYGIRKSTEFHLNKIECQRILFNFLLLILS